MRMVRPSPADINITGTTLTLRHSPNRIGGGATFLFFEVLRLFHKTFKPAALTRVILCSSRLKTRVKRRRYSSCAWILCCYLSRQEHHSHVCQGDPQ
jgi:hypothetical protein